MKPSVMARSSLSGGNSFSIPMFVLQSPIESPILGMRTAQYTKARIKEINKEFVVTTKSAIKSRYRYRLR